MKGRAEFVSTEAKSWSGTPLRKLASDPTMNVAAAISRHKFVSFLVGTAVVQAIALAAALFLRERVISAPSAPSPAVSEPIEAGAPAEIGALVEPTESLGAGPAPSAADQITLPTQVVFHTVKRGETLSTIWSHHGAARSGGALASKALAAADPKGAALKEGETLELTLSASGDVVGLKKRVSETSTLVLEGDSTNGYTASRSDVAVSESERTVSGIITESFALAAQESDVPYAVIDDLVDLFSGRVAFERSIQPGDSFAVSFVERRTPSGEVLSPGPIVRASLGTGGRMIAAIRHVSDDGQARYYAETGLPLGNTFLRYPLRFTRISSIFNEARLHPVLNKKRPHNGVDFAAPIGTPVRAVADGVVVFAGWLNGGGNTVRIKHCDRYTTEYMHLSKIGRGVRVGAPVSRGGTIGAVGMTGLATGPHLHFGLFDRGRFVNPLKADLPQVTNVEPLAPHYVQASLTILEQHHSSVRLAYLAAEKQPA